jgi:YfiH family protein
MNKHRFGPLEFYSYDAFADHDAVSCVVTTRVGGLSTGEFAMFNLGLSCGDDPGAVIDNRAQLGSLTGAFPDLLTFGRQVHGTRIAVVTGDLIGSGAFDREASIPDTDAMITDIPDVPLVVLVADCASVSLYDPVRGAIGLAHAGWRGTAAGIAGATVAKMTEAFGSDPADMIAGIGPSIGPCCYEVGRDVIDRFSDDLADIAPIVLGGTAVGAAGHSDVDKAQLDLWQANQLQLVATGIPEGRVEVAGLCTSCHTEMFYSHRAENGRTGRFAALVMLHNRSRRAY